ncbi:hypothetical protein Q5P01_025405 [Channa striata]|uniref:Uncharacterized protein n=1 Tax=Channa striata TaxID=64152 RepID=A0AA88LI63_CHASR|nr:hypothetical protein Q5P01_025405 [Channa striata]
MGHRSEFTDCQPSPGRDKLPDDFMTPPSSSSSSSSRPPRTSERNCSSRLERKLSMACNSYSLLQKEVKEVLRRLPGLEEKTGAAAAASSRSRARLMMLGVIQQCPSSSSFPVQPKGPQRGESSPLENLFSQAQ